MIVRRVVLESPYYGDTVRNVNYARACMRDCLLRKESPIASHLLYTQPDVLNDHIPEERKLGMEAGWAWMRLADACVVYTDYGISNGMNEGIAAARKAGLPIEFRSLEKKCP